MNHQLAWNTIFNPSQRSTASADQARPGHGHKRPRPAIPSSLGRGGGGQGGRGRGGDGRGGRGRGGRGGRSRHDRDEISAEILDRAAKLAVMPTNTPEEIQAYREARAAAFPKRPAVLDPAGSLSSASDDDQQSDQISPPEPLPSPPTDTSFDHLKGVCWRYLRSQCRRGRQCSYQHDPDVRAKFLENEVEAPRRLGRLRCPRPVTKLLGHLLKAEIDRQHDVLIDCLRYLDGRQFLQEPIQMGSVEDS